MKKLFFIAICCLILCGCEKNEGYEVSKLTADSSLGISHIKGTLKNISNNNCKTVQINVILSSGTITEDGWIWVDSPEIGNSISFNNILYGISNSLDIEDYDIKLKNIECEFQKETN